MADYARGERLRNLRETKHASQEAVAFEVGVSTKTLRSWEHGGKIRWENAKRLAEYYGEDAESLVARETPALNGDIPSAPTQLDRIEQRVNELHDLLFGDGAHEADFLEGLASRLLRGVESPPKRTAARRRSPAAAQQRKHA